jgi:rifampicin phosphotransferase
MKNIEILIPPYSDNLPRLGGKAGNLARLNDLGFNVPPFVVIPHDSLSAVLPQGLDVDGLRRTILEFAFPESMTHEILTFFQKGKDKAPGFFAVRSSGLVEDGALHSFAGQYATELYVAPEVLVAAIRKVWASAYSDQVKAYSLERGLDWKGGGISIIIQEMVAADVAGVGFGLHPTEGWRDAVVLSAVYGLGEGLVSGELDADTYVIRAGTISKTIVQKEKGLYYDLEQQKNLYRCIPPGSRDSPALRDVQIFQLTGLIQQLNRALGRPQDIEFAFAEEQLYLLQTRPVTELGKLPDSSAHRIVWDNSNIIESYPGVTTPLTFSFIIKMYEAVYRQMSAIMGVPEQVIEREGQVFANMLGLLRGRVYYNLESWYRALAMLPGYRVNARFMETMMGVKERFDLPEDAEKVGNIRAWARLLWSVFKMLGLFFQLPAERRKFKATLDSIILEYQGLDFDTMRPDASMQRYLFFENFLLKKWKAPLVNDFFAMIFFGILKKKCASINPENPSLHNDLLTGSRDIISTEPVRRILAIADALHADPDARAYFLEQEALTVWNNLAKFPKVHTLVQEYLQAFGERTVGELKLETITYTQEPERFIAILQSYASQALPPRGAQDDAAIRVRAENEVASAFKRAPLKKWFFHWILKTTRVLVSGRENLRYERTRGFGVVRRIFSGIGRQFASEGILEKAQDIFYLTKEEIFDFIKGTAVSQNLRELVELRKAEYAQYAAETPLPERITTFSTVYHANDFRAAAVEQKGVVTGSDQGNTLQGLGCSAGVVRGRVRVVHRPDELRSLEGDILVTSSTDPGWVALFPSASAVLVERGSLLSHSAIVSRELGIPCVVGISGLLTRLKTGDEVELNGTTGTVLIF